MPYILQGRLSLLRGQLLSLNHPLQQNQTKRSLLNVHTYILHPAHGVYPLTKSHDMATYHLTVLKTPTDSLALVLLLSHQLLALPQTHLLVSMHY